MSTTTLGDEEERFLEDIGETVETVRPLPRFPWEQVLGYLTARYGRAGVVRRFRERISMGQEQYGPINLETDKHARDFMKELDDELLDATFYDWCEFRKAELTP